jgi:hypothetical protein
MGGNVTIEDLERFRAKKTAFELNERAMDLAIYFYDLQERAPVIDAVYDAIEGFCEDGCVWRYSPKAFTGPAPSFWQYRTGCDRYVEQNVPDLSCNCTACGRRVIERFDILKEEGV